MREVLKDLIGLIATEINLLTHPILQTCNHLLHLLKALQEEQANKQRAQVRTQLPCSLHLQLQEVETMAYLIPQVAAGSLSHHL